MRQHHGFSNLRPFVSTRFYWRRQAGRLRHSRAGPGQVVRDVIGVVVEISEDQIDAVTALAGSGPAFVYTVIEALARGGEKMGLAADAALVLATQTVLGAAQLAAETKLSPQELRKMVVTPGG